jgi:hypothetical protein
MELKPYLSLILLIHFVVAPIPSPEWRDVSILLERTLGSAHFAADFLSVTFEDMISAQERINVRFLFTILMNYLMSMMHFIYMYVFIGNKIKELKKL